ncbi:hypothetical protein Amet_1344 [Alkaliphilus metalliredigens QYMF]|uniref:Uncharacterized protein n=1 Tax=Alkaliphilus metalliredigens (strain QYMF) TaxID=293826 RepID=A6TMX6_ALKMQ|nr:hypothetical protein [Alkaliphilus metalliredigens]ABR47544.1 hypothetical protein Amet_1344 [Alkaliphilus metalliredigens QYMF]
MGFGVVGIKTLFIDLPDFWFISSVASDVMKQMAKYPEKDKVRGLIKYDVDATLLVEMLYSLARSNMEVFLKKLTDGINIIRDGIFCK